MERDYWSKRRLEARYRRLLDMVSERFIVVDDSSGRILEANPVAATLLAGAGATLVGKPFPLGLGDDARNTLDRLTREARSVTTTVDGMINTDAGLELNIAITYLRQSGEGRLLIRLRDDSKRDLTGAEFQSFFSDAPDGILELDEQGIVLAANTAFLEMAGIVSPELVEGRRADRWMADQPSISILCWITPNKKDPYACIRPLSGPKPNPPWISNYRWPGSVKMALHVSCSL